MDVYSLLGPRIENLGRYWRAHAVRMQYSTMTSSSSIKAYPMHPRIALITPLRDEEVYIGAMIESIVKQQIQPAKWLIVDDGSTDRTPAIVKSYCQRFEFIELLGLPFRSERSPGGEGAIAHGLHRLDLSQYDYLARFDADLVFEDNYFVRILDEFAKDSRLGIAGGGLYINRKNKLVLEQAPDYHVRGAVKMYRRECFEQLCNLGTDIGWDTIDEVYAWSRGWRTHSFFDIQVIHRRPTGEGLHANRIYRERGRAEYLTWSHPAFVLLKSAKIALGSPANARYFLSGFFHSHKMHHSRLADPEFKWTRRHQQLVRALNLAMPEFLRDIFFKKSASQHADRY
jgi:biofilm PGA synthesis N-glycosyltransferase PgaC